MLEDVGRLHQDKMDEKDEKEVTLKSSTLNKSNLAMIFRLDLNQGIYNSSEEGEIILPSDTAFYHVEDLEKTYFVNGERMTPNSVSLVVPEDGHKNKSQPSAWTECACRINSLCTLLTDEVSSVSDICTWISPDGSTSTTTSDFFHAT